MKIGVLIDRVQIGGVEKIALDECIALDKLGYDVTLLTLSGRYTIPEAFADKLNLISIRNLDQNIPKILKINFRIRPFHFFSFFHISYPLLLLSVIKSKEYDLIISHNPFTTFTALFFKIFKQIPYRYYVHDHISYIFKNVYAKGKMKLIFLVLSRVAILIDKTLLNNADRVFVQGSSHFSDLSSLIKEKAKLNLIFPAYDAIKSVPRKDGYFLMATAWKKGKNLKPLLEYLSERKLKPKLVLAGAWLHKDYLTDIQSFIKAHKMDSHISLLGEVTEQKLQTLYMHANGVIITSSELGYGLPVLEGGAHGTSFIAPDTVGAARYFIDRNHGYFYEYNDFNGLYSAMNELSSNAQARAMGTSILQKVKQDYSWNAHVNILLTGWQK